MAEYCIGIGESDCAGDLDDAAGLYAGEEFCFDCQVEEYCGDFL